MLWAGAIFYLSIIPGVQLPEIPVSPDKLGHFVAYGLLTWLIFLGFQKQNKWTVGIAVWTVVGVSLYGILLEFVQWAFFPHRFFEVWDMIANITGAFAAFIGFKLITNKIN